MFLKRRKQKAAPQVVAHEVNQWDIPRGSLEFAQLNPRLISHYGVPSTASSLSFDPVQRMLAICTLDGRIKLFGRDGIEGLLQSDQQLPCKFVESLINCGLIINITSRNDIQIWDTQKGELAHSHRWHAEITAFAVIQGSPYMYIGEDSGNVVVFQYDREGNKFFQMPYYIPALGGMTTTSYDIGPSVVGILPKPDAEFSRVVIVYGNGLIMLWGLQEAQVLAIRGVTSTQWQRLIGNPYDLRCNVDPDALNQEVKDEKDICCACWTGPAGTILAIGYTDGDIYLWSFSSISKGQLFHTNELFGPTDAPLLKIQVSLSKNKAPVVFLRWSAESTTNSGGSGQLYVFGGGELGCPEVLTIFHLTWTDTSLNDCNMSRLELSLNGPFDDLILLPAAGSTFSDPAAAFLVLTSPGHLHAYEGASISKFFLEYHDNTHIPPYPEPITLQWPFVEPIITVATLVSLTDDVESFSIFSNLPRHLMGIAPSVLPSGTKWPVTGGVLSAFSSQESTARMIYISGHKDGSVNVWDASPPALSHLCRLQNKPKAGSLESGTASISALDFCPVSGVLVVADEHGMVCLYTLSANAGEVSCLLINKSVNQEQAIFLDAGFQCKAIFNLHQAAITSLTVSSASARVAVGCTSGWVSIIDVNACSVLFHGLCFTNSFSKVVSLNFGPAAASRNSASTSPACKNVPQLQSSAKIALYAVAEDATLVALDGDTGLVLGSPWQTDYPSKAVSLHLLDVEGSTPCYLLLCNEDSLHLYCLSTSMQVVCVSLRTASFQAPCCWTSTFVIQNSHSAGLVLGNKNGFLQIRSLPDLEILMEISLGECLKWDFQLGSNFSRTLTCATNGQMALIDRDKELILLSLLANQNDPRVPNSFFKFFDEDIAAAANAAFKAELHATKRKSQIQGLLGVVLKDFKEGVLKNTPSGKEQPGASSVISDLSRLFETSPFTVDNATINQDVPSETKEAKLDELELEIDDIHIEEDVGSSSPVVFGSPSGSKFINTVKGKEKESDITDDRVKLFGEEEEAKKPKRRTAEDIKAAYGHRKSGDISGTAGLARDKLLERQEKLQALSKRTEEMQEGAKNFASMAVDLTKAMEGRKWWQL